MSHFNVKVTLEKRAGWTESYGGSVTQFPAGYYAELDQQFVYNELGGDELFEHSDISADDALKKLYDTVYSDFAEDQDTYFFEVESVVDRTKFTKFNERDHYHLEKHSKNAEIIEFKNGVTTIDIDEDGLGHVGVVLDRFARMKAYHYNENTTLDELRSYVTALVKNGNMTEEHLLRNSFVKLQQERMGGFPWRTSM